MKEMIAKLKAIGDSHRLRILHLLSYGELGVSGLQQALGLKQAGSERVRERSMDGTWK